MSELIEWLRGMGLEKYADQFEKNEIDIGILPYLNDNDLRELGLPLGPRKKILRAIHVSPIHNESNDTSYELPSVNSNPSEKNRPYQAESRHLTVMFCDLIGSTSLSHQYDPEDLCNLIRNYQDYCKTITDRFNGFVAQYLGDGILVYFGYPTAGEDDADHAVEAGLEICNSINILTEKVGLPLALRIGIASGRVVANQRRLGLSQDHLLVGETPNLAAHLQALAPENSVVISQSTKDLLSNTFGSEDMGTHKIQGVSNAVQIFQIVSKHWATSRFTAKTKELYPLVGRQKYLRILEALWNDSVDGRGQAIVLSGEAGIGKSRLVRTISEIVESQGASILNLQCSPLHQNTALYPVYCLLSELGNLNNITSDETRLEALYQTILNKYDDPITATISLAAIFNLQKTADSRFGSPTLSPAQRRTRLFQTLTDWLIESSTDTPILLVIEDLHWVDPTTQEWILSVISQLESRKICLLMTARPGETELRFHDGPVTQLTLSRLNRLQVQKIILAISSRHPLEQAACDSISTRADGIPLYVEELTRAVIHYPNSSSTRDSEPLVPESLQDSLMSRLDRLGPAKKIAQLAASIGREFSFGQIESISGPTHQDISEILNLLCENKILNGFGQPPDSHYQFTHALLRDAAYASLLRSDRRKIHAAIFQELSNSETVAEEALAIHAKGAGLLKQSAFHFTLAGDQASARPALAEAQLHYRNAIELYEQFPDDLESKLEHLGAYIKLVYACQAAHGYAHVSTVDALREAEELVNDVDDPQLEFSYLVANWGKQIALGEPDKALNTASRAVASGIRQANQTQQSIAHCCKAMGNMMAGDFNEADADFELSIRIHRNSSKGLDPAQHSVDQGIRIRSIWSFNLICQGFNSQAKLLLDNIENDAIELKHPATHGFAVYWDSIVSNLGKSPDRALKIDHCLSVITELELVAWIGPSKFLLATTMHEEGNIEDSACTFETAFGDNAHAGWLWMLSYYQAIQISNLLLLKRQDEAKKLLQQVLHRIKFGAEKWANAEVLRLLAVAYLDEDPIQAGLFLKQSIDVAKAQKAHLWNLRATYTKLELHDSLGESKIEATRQLKAALIQFPPEGKNMTEYMLAKAIFCEPKSEDTDTG